MILPSLFVDETLRSVANATKCKFLTLGIQDSLYRQLDLMTAQVGLHGTLKY